MQAIKSTKRNNSIQCSQKNQLREYNDQFRLNQKKFALFLQNNNFLPSSLSSIVSSRLSSQ